jgi:hypothetical protein
MLTTGLIKYISKYFDTICLLDGLIERKLGKASHPEKQNSLSVFVKPLTGPGGTAGIGKANAFGCL